MKKHFKRFLILLLVIVTVSSMGAPAMAAMPPDSDAPQSSAYISAVYASASAGSSSVSVSLYIAATGKMTSLGSTTIVLYTSGGSYVGKKTYTSYPAMLGYNKSYHSDTETFYNLSSGKYYAIVYFKASNSSGYDTTSYTTSYATVG